MGFSIGKMRLKLYKVIGAAITFVFLCFLMTEMVFLPPRTSSSGEPIITQVAVEELHQAHKLAIIVPFRDRFEELLEFVPHLHVFLEKKAISHRFFVMNQADGLRFNRASLINIGYHMSKNECDYLAMHDVDLLPQNLALDYGYPEGYVHHVAAPHLHPLYHYPTFVGGILILTHNEFLKLNGLSNRYWGWGREDDEFYVRMKEQEVIIKRPDKDVVTTGNETFRHIHDKRRRPRDNKRYFNQKEAGSKRDTQTGVNNVQYNVSSHYTVTINKVEVHIYNVELHCNITDTPWCMDPPK